MRKFPAARDLGLQCQYFLITIHKPLGLLVRMHPFVGRDHATFAAGLISAPNTEWAEKAIAQSEVFPKSQHDDIHDSVTQRVNWLHSHGLISPNFEVAAELREAMEFRLQPKGAVRCLEINRDVGFGG
ncbi:hypothetical protein [Bradyrhizobium cenepequi]|uniref:hypothetical protein n=1 Tax=Bradyrhizobium cenepequi TaxID=2821403 RepID=UPI001CE2AD5B|nr:hypothetical protein [Bradyrhizobium cenepequi]MCA6112903.1 hypothetical protein [Bradyrhizobium cenepequi]